MGQQNYPPCLKPTNALAKKFLDALACTITMSAPLTVSIIGHRAAALYEPATVLLARQAGMAPSDAARMAARGTGLLFIGAMSRSRARPAAGEMPRRRRQDSGRCRPRGFGDDEARPHRFTLAPNAPKPDNKAPA